MSGLYQGKSVGSEKLGHFTEKAKEREPFLTASLYHENTRNFIPG
jgi:hypothetical protein